MPVKYVSYNRLSVRGEGEGRKYKMYSGTSAESVRRRTLRANARWNERQGEGGKYKAKLVEVKRVVTRPKKQRPTNPFAVFGGFK